MSRTRRGCLGRGARTAFALGRGAARSPGSLFRTLHPEILGHTVGWVPDEPVQVYRRPHDFVRSNGYLSHPIVRVLETQTPVVLRVDPHRDAPWTESDLFKGRPLAELVVLPLRTPDALPSGVSFATTRSTGFTAAERAAFDRIAPALRNACELRNLRQVEQTLLDTYLGTLTGRRVLEGRVRRGELERLEAALLLCDLREFTDSPTGCRANGYSSCSMPTSAASSPRSSRRAAK